MPKIAKRVPWFLADFHKDKSSFNKYNSTVFKIIYWTIAFWRNITDIQRNNGDMIILSSTFVCFESSATTTYIQYIHLPICQWPVRVYLVRAKGEVDIRKDIIWAVTCDFKQCGILTSVYSDKPVQPTFKLRTSKWCSVSSLILIEYSNKSSDQTERLICFCLIWFFTSHQQSFS